MTLGRETHHFLPDKVDGHVEVLQAQYLGAFMSMTDHVLNLPFVMCQEWIHIVLVKEAGALGLWEDEIAHEEKADPAIEREPVCEERDLLA